ncbi:MAG TPA: aldehyde dehydrogenase family protein [Bacteroidia bacterium]|jgi:glyceraldehyde-3-phosphate dehydrogenase (NADP+)|nr:aldehyde dehydrogenase family protein [Bacteroidia bacterium]
MTGNMVEHLIYCGGKFISTSDVMKIRDPFSGENFASTYRAGKNELEIAIAAAQKVRREMAEMPSHKKYSILRKISDEITHRREELALLLSKESAKPFRYAVSEVDRAAQTFLIAAEESKRLPKEYISLDWTPAGEKKEGLVKYFPSGIVAGISPFNFPLNLAVHKIAPAIAAGCPIILKPASSTPLSTLALAKIIDQTELPKGAVSILPMDRLAGNQLVTDDRFSLLSFTGSPEVGWKMKADAGKKKVVLELGGNAGVIITENADMDLAVKKCLVGGFAYSGQICIHAQRIFVQKNVFENFVGEFCKGATQLVNGDPADPKTKISMMIDEENAKRVEEWVNEAVKAGAKILSGGKRNGNYFEPTVITNSTVKMKVNCEEVFGPVVIVEKYDSFTEAIQLINDTKFGLQAGVFTYDAREIEKAFHEIEVGGVIINDVPTFRVDHMPYGGIKDSGLGREGVKYAILDMMEAKILCR